MSVPPLFYIFQNNCKTNLLISPQTQRKTKQNYRNRDEKPVTSEFASQIAQQNRLLGRMRESTTHSEAMQGITCGLDCAL